MGGRDTGMVRPKPLIGVTEPAKGGYLSWCCIRTAVALAGGKAIKLTADKPQQAKILDGLILAGGSDINPALYGAPVVLTETYDHARDQLEQDWFKIMYTQSKPILGICRGAQMINVCLDGNLYESIRLICEEAKYPRNILSKIFARKPIAILPNSRLANLLKRPLVYEDAEDFLNAVHNDYQGTSAKPLQRNLFGAEAKDGQAENSEPASPAKTSCCCIL